MRVTMNECIIQTLEMFKLRGYMLIYNEYLDNSINVI